jgi:hypothetical protein
MKPHLSRSRCWNQQMHYQWYLVCVCDQMGLSQDGKQCQHMIPKFRMRQIMLSRRSSRGLTHCSLMNFKRLFMQRQRSVPLIPSFCSKIITVIWDMNHVVLCSGTNYIFKIFCILKIVCLYICLYDDLTHVVKHAGRVVDLNSDSNP